MRGLILVLLALFVLACTSPINTKGAKSATQPRSSASMVLTTRGEEHGVSKDCPDGRVTTVIFALDSKGPEGVRIRGVEGLVKNGDEIVREACGQRYKWARAELMPNGDVKLHLYDKLIPA